MKQIQLEQQKVLILPDGRMTRREAAKFLGYSTSTLADWHRTKRGPPSRMVGGRRFYHIDDLRAFAGEPVAA